MTLRPGPKPPFGGLHHSVLTPLLPDEWLAMMERNAYVFDFDTEAEEVMRGITEGMNIGFIGDRTINTDCRNLTSATDNPEVEQKVHDLIMVNVASGKTSGPHDTKPFAAFRISPIGAVPKRPSPGCERKVTDIRVIHHLSHPFGGDSINNMSIDVPLKLGNFDQAMTALVKHGRGCSMTKIDVKAAYKLVPVRYEDWCLLGFRWRGKYYYERTLPFGLKSSCRQWEAYATALHHSLIDEVGIPSVVHYVDDFLFVEKDKQSAQAHLETTLGLCVRIGLPIAHDKTEGPTTKLTFLGIELDSSAMTARLSAERLVELTQLLNTWGKKRHASIEQLQSLAGVLNWACQVVRPGRTFLRRIIDHTMTLNRQDDHQREAPIPNTVYKDIEWWRDFAPRWNGISLLYQQEWTDAVDIEMYTDACNEGYGARYGSRWIHGKWTNKQRANSRTVDADDPLKQSMPYLELLALTIAVATWGHRWSGMKITFRSDCLPVVQAITSGTSSRSRSMTLLRTIHAIAALHNFDFRCTHIKGIWNVDADLLSRGDVQSFLQSHPDGSIKSKRDRVGSIHPFMRM